MRYYLSYIEAGEHSSFALTEQLSVSEPPKVLSEIGFARSPDEPQGSYFTYHKGHVRQESNFSMALYGSMPVRHKTFEISRDEMERFLHIINRDMRVNAADVKWLDDEGGENLLAVGGPGYQKLGLFGLNCKIYAMSVLKELGIVEADTLENFLIQRPGVVESELTRIGPEDVSCPMKEKFIDETTSLLKDIIKDLELINENRNSVSFQFKSGKINASSRKKAQEEFEPKFFALVDEAIALAKTLDNPKSKRKLGIETVITTEKYRNSEYPYPEHYDLSYQKAYHRLQTLLYANIYSFGKKAKIMVNSSHSGNEAEQFDNDAMKAVMEKLYKYADDIEDTKQGIKKIENAALKFDLEFFWKKLPTIFPRQSLESFDDTEKTQYRYREVSDCLDQVLLQLDNKLQSESVDDDFSYDLKNLKAMVSKTKKEIDNNSEKFMNSEKKRDVKYCVVENDAKIDEPLRKLQLCISNLRLRSKESNIFVLLINRILSFFNKKYFDVGESARIFMTRQLTDIKDGKLFSPKGRGLSSNKEERDEKQAEKHRKRPLS